MMIIIIQRISIIIVILATSMIVIITALTIVSIINNRVAILIVNNNYSIIMRGSVILPPGKQTNRKKVLGLVLVDILIILK